MNKYATPQAFRSAFDATLRKRAGTAPLAGLPWADIDAVTNAACAFLDPVLSTSNEAMWEPST